MKNLFILLVGLVVLAGCNTSYEKSKSGLRYKIIKGKGGKQLKIGDFVQYHQILTIPERDTVFSSTYGKMHAYVKIDTGGMTAYTPLEIFPKLSVGDSLVVVLSADSLVKRQMASYDDNIRRGGTLTWKIKITNSYATIEEVQAVVDKERQVEQQRQMKEQAEKGKKEQAEMEEYLRKNKINTVKTPSGAFVEIQQKGTGPMGDTGAVAQVFYTGKLLKDGKAFDSNIDPKFQHTDPIQVELGKGGVIAGFGEGLMLFGKGGKGRIFIPAYLGYGAQGSGPIPPNSALIFEVEVKDILPPNAAPPPNVVAPQAH